jgi:PAS domain S-box-containing protein
MPASRRAGQAASTTVRPAPPSRSAAPPEPSGTPPAPRGAGLHALAASLGVGFERAAVGMALLDLDGRVVRANRSMCELLGRSPAQLAGRSLLALLRREDRADLVGRVTAALAAGEEALGSAYRCVVDGGVEVAASVTVLRDDEGEPSALLAECHDLSELGRERRSLLRQLVTVQEDERRRLAASLHDDTVQALAAALLTLDVLEARADRALADRAGAAEALQAVRAAAGRIRRNVEHGLRSARTFMFDLRPQELDEVGLEAAVRRQLERLAERCGWSVELRWAPGGALERDRETILFRAVQELLANAARHAGAASLSVRARRAGGMVAVEVADDGGGFDPDEALARAPGSGRVGLRSVAERLEGAGGALRVRAAPGRGTKVEVRLPAGTPPGG